jgi:hypothetical protein
MGNGSSSGTWKGWLAAGVMCAIGIGFGLYICRIIKICPPPPEPNLVIEDDENVAWMAITNTFTYGHDANGNTIFDRDLSAGLLVQIGDYEHGDLVPDRVDIVNSDTTVDSYQSGDFSWINVLRDPAGSPPPMDPGKHEFVLYPNNVYVNGPCKNVDACADKAFSCDGCATQMGALVPGCLRQRLLHADFHLTSILTYWQGPGGYSTDTQQTASSSRSGQTRNSYKFTFKDPFAVDVYKYSVANPDTTPVKSYPAGTVTRIIIRKGKAKGPGNGDHMSPPWPPPEP